MILVAPMVLGRQIASVKRLFKKGGVMKDKRHYGKTVAIITLATTFLAASAFWTSTFAARPHFIGSPSCTETGGELCCSGKIAGLGNVTEVEANLVADVLVTFDCQNPAGKIAPGQSDLQDVPGETQTLPVTNGQTTFTDLCVEGPQLTSAVCPNRKWDVINESFTFSNVSINVGDVSLEIPAP
jgi:hypothetical protein